MKNFILTVAFALATFVGANAQIAYQKANVFDNTSVTVQGGITSPMTFDHVTPFNPVAGVKLSKEFNPVFGMNVEGDVLFGKNDYSHSSTFVKSQYVGFNGTVNLTNLFLGYNPAKTFVASVEAGAGWIHRYDNGNGYVNALNEHNSNHLGAKTGLVFGWNLGNAKQLQVFANPTVFWNLTDNGDGHNIQFNKDHAQLAVLAGITYKFRTSNGTHNFKVFDITAMNNEINSLRNELAKKPKEIVKTVTNTKVVETVKWPKVQFKQGSSVIEETSMANIYDIADAIKDDGKTYLIEGFASTEGRKIVNDKLSVARAKALANALIKAGVPANKLVVKGEGATNKFNPDELPTNRVATTTEKK